MSANKNYVVPRPCGYVDSIVGQISLPRKSAMYILKHWRSLGLKIDRYCYARGRYQYTVGGDHLAHGKDVYTVFS